MRKLNLKSLRGKGKKLIDRIKSNVDELRDAKDSKILENSDRENLSRFAQRTTPEIIEQPKSNNMIYLVGAVVLILLIFKRK